MYSRNQIGKTPGQISMETYIFGRLTESFNDDVDTEREEKRKKSEDKIHFNGSLVPRPGKRVFIYNYISVLIRRD